MILKEAIQVLDKEVQNPTDGLPDDIFYYISRTTPLINVDLLIKDPKKGTLLSWRNDEHHGKGWHIPGGIIRYKENMYHRIQEVAKLEIGIEGIKVNPNILAVNEIIAPDKTNRAHFISLLYECFLDESYELNNDGKTSDDSGYLQWFKYAPNNLLFWHEIYRQYINEE